MTEERLARLERLEAIAAEQERTIEELSAELAEQWKTVERLQKKLDRLTERFLALEEAALPEAPATRPPHY